MGFADRVAARRPETARSRALFVASTALVRVSCRRETQTITGRDFSLAATLCKLVTVGLLGASMAPGTAHAQSFGGNGRGSNANQGNGGGFGQPGQQGSGAGTIDPGGGGGGGAGAAGGADGDVGDEPINVGGAAGTSGSVAAPGGTNGQTPGGNGGGGGGGGNGILNAAGPVVLTQPVSGGNGGTAALSGGQSGGGGSGGYGVVGSNGPPAIITITLTPSQAVPNPAIRGGNGGNGGQSLSGNPGAGGDGGVGVYLRSTGSSLDVVSGSVIGGTGGTGGAAGKGGVGVQVDNGATILNAGAIQGGLANGAAAGAARANALSFTSGASTLTTNAGGSYVGNFAIAIGATLTLDQTAAAGANASATYANPITGAGAVLVQSDGGRIVTLTGTNTYTGSTTVNSGRLEVDGSIASPNVAVNNGGMLSGTGAIGTTTAGNVGTTIAAGGTLSPGNAATPYGTLGVNGPLAFAAGSFYTIAITPTQNSRTNVVGTTTINGGTVNVVAGNGTYQARRYTIINATTGVTGTFTGVASNLAFLMPTLTYDPNNVYLNITGNGANGSVDYRTAARTQNQVNVASGLTVAGRSNPGGAGGRVLDGLNQLTVAQAQAAFDALSGEGITATQALANRSAQLFNDAIFDQTTFYGNGGAGNQIVLTDAPPAFTAYAPLTGARAPLYGPPVRELADLPAAHIAPTFVAPARTWRAWATGFGGTEDIHGNGAIGSAAQDNTIYGGALGVDYQVTQNYLFGVAVGGSDGNFQVPGRTTYGSTTGGHIAIYDLATFGSFYGASSSSFSYFTNRTTRFVGGFGGLGSETERGDFDSHEYRTRLEFGRHFDGLFGFGGTLTPFLALEIAELRSDGFGETSVAGPGLFRLNVSGQSAADVPGYLGLRYQTIMPLGGMTFLPSLQVAYVHEFAPYRSQTGALADLPGSTFLVDGARPARHAAQAKAGGELKLGANSSLFANFDGEFSGVNQLYAGKGGFRWVW